jgi:hypothetical protein
MKNISTGSVVGRIEDMVAGDIDDEKVMMSVEKGRYYSLDPVDAPLAEYDVDRKTCERDVVAFLEELHENGIIKVEDWMFFLYFNRKNPPSPHGTDPQAVIQGLMPCKPVRR